MISKSNLWGLLILGSTLLPCQSMAQTSEPFKSYDFLCELFDESYASFDEKGLDWQAMCTEKRKELSPETTDVEFFNILSSLLAPLNDAHVTLKAPLDILRFSASRPSNIMSQLGDMTRTQARSGFIEMVTQTLSDNQFEVRTTGPIFRDESLFVFGDNGQIGYLGFYRCFSKPGNMIAASLEGQLDEIFTSFEGLQSIVVDVRFNMGGEDFFSHAVASRFVQQEMLAYVKQTRKKGEFGPIKERLVKAAEKPWLKPVIVLTNDRTVSAADIFLLIMDNLPQVTIMGDRTNGSYSDIYSRKLPNGWTINLSNQRYLTVDGNNYEGLGNPVDIEAHNTAGDFKEKNDRVLMKAVHHLSGGD